MPLEYLHIIISSVANAQPCLICLSCIVWHEFAYTCICTCFAMYTVQHCLARICIYTLCICTHFVLYLYCLAWICIHRLPGWVPVRPGGKVNSWPDMNSNWAQTNISSNLFWIDIVRWGREKLRPSQILEGCVVEIHQSHLAVVECGCWYIHSVSPPIYLCACLDYPKEGGLLQKGCKAECR